MVLHLGYGIVAGAVFAVGVPVIGLELTDLLVATGLGMVYGFVLMLVGLGFWMRVVIRMEGDRETMQTLGVVHVVYGAVLGAFIGAGIVA
jgi:hypothetical protein